jgi:glycosyltransferase involved in cell wall biosynthesis
LGVIKLSVVIIAFNEEKNIERCLLSVKKVADEIVVLDSGSTDQTQAICAKHGVKFFHHAFDGHIQQKNRAITYASNPHILSLDSDEALNETLIESILEAKKNFSHQGYYSGHWVKHCGWYPDTKLRLWDSRLGHWTGVNPHDKYELFEGDSKTTHLKGDILHYSYYTLDDHYKQVDYFTNISANAYFEKGKNAPMYKMIVNPVAKFIDHYFLHLGFLDGKAGYLISKISAYATYLKYKKLRNLNKNAKR